mgnify:CR=1 FL=1
MAIKDTPVLRSEIDRIFCKGPCLILTHINNGDYIRQVAKKINTSPSSLMRVVLIFEKTGIVTFRYEGRKTFIYLTKKGEVVKESLRKLLYK